MRRLLAILLLLPATLALAANDISGTWSGSMDLKTPDGQVNSTPVSAEFKQSGQTVTGTAGAIGHEALLIEKGAIDGDRLTFEVDGGRYAVKVTLISESQMKGEVTIADPSGNKVTAAITLTRK